MAKFFDKAILRKIPKMLLATFKGFSNDNGLKLSASLAYYTLFSLGPLLLLLLSLVTIFYGGEAASVQVKVFSQMNNLLGSSAAKQIQEIITNLQFSDETNFALAISIITLLIGATSLFIEIQDSLNMIWKLKAKPKKGWLAFLKNRLLSSSMIISIGFLLIVTLLVNGVIAVLMGRLEQYFGPKTALLMVGINIVITFLVISVLFAIIFKFLPDAKIQWKHVRTGAVFTAILFMIGRYLIGLYIEKTGTESTYGAAGSIVILLIWIYYSAAILYLGAEFTQVYTDALGGHIEPAEYAVHVEQTEVERDVRTLPQQHKDIDPK